MEDAVVPLERNLYDHPLAGLLWERQFEKILLKYGWEKVSSWECLFVHREKGTPGSHVMQERRIDDYWNIDGSRDVSASWTVSLSLLYWKRNLQTGICCPGRD